MKTFLAIFTCAENSKNHEAWKRLSPEEQNERAQKGAQAQARWSANHQNQIVFEGGSVGKVTKTIDIRGVNDGPSQMGAFIVIQATSHEDAAKIFLDHPHFAFFPGDGVEVMECLSTPL